MKQCKAEISRFGINAAENALSSESQEKANEILKSANDEVAEISKRYSQQIGNSIKKSFERIGAKFDVYNDSVFVQQVNANVADLINKETSAGKFLPGGIGALAGGLVAKYGVAVAAPYAIQQTMRIATAVNQLAPVVENQVANAATVALTVKVEPTAGVVLGECAGKGAGMLFRAVTNKIFTAPPTMTNRIAQFIMNNAGKSARL